MTSPAKLREIAPSDPDKYYGALVKACIHEGSPTVMNWAGVKWTRVNRNGAQVFVNSGLLSQMDAAYGGGTMGYAGTAEMGGGLPEGPGDHPHQSVTTEPVQPPVTEVFDHGPRRVQEVPAVLPHEPVSSHETVIAAELAERIKAGAGDWLLNMIKLTPEQVAEAAALIGLTANGDELGIKGEKGPDDTGVMGIPGPAPELGATGEKGIPGDPGVRDLPYEPVGATDWPTPPPTPAPVPPPKKPAGGKHKIT